MVPEGWAVRSLRDVLERVVKPVALNSSKHYKQIGVRSHGKGIFVKEPVTGQEIGNKRVFWVEPNCLVVNIVFAWEQAVDVTAWTHEGKIASHRFPMYRPAKNECDVQYLRYLFLTPRGKHLLRLASPGGAGRNRTLGQKEFERLAVPLPPLPEQKKIAEILSTWDKAIETTEKLLANAEAQKRALMQQLLTGKRRLPGQTSEWITDELANVLSAIRGGGTPDKGNQSYWNGEIPWMSVKDMKGDVVLNTEDYITETGLQQSATSIVPADTVVIATRMAVGACVLTATRMAINQDLERFSISLHHIRRQRSSLRTQLA